MYLTRLQRLAPAALVALAATLSPRIAAAAGLIVASTPEQSATVTGRKPRIVVDFAAALQVESLAVVLDGQDVTPVARVSEKGLEYVPVVALPPGAHTLAITARDVAGAAVSGTLRFASRHSAAFEEVRTDNELGLNYEYAVKKPGKLLQAPDSKFEGNLKVDVRGRNAGFTLGTNANLAFLQPHPATPKVEGASPYPPEEEVNLMDFLVSASYVSGGAGVTAEIGTLQIDQTQRTVSGMSRRGSRLGLQAGWFDASAFMFRGESTVGPEDPAGIGGTEDHLYGFTAGAGFFDGGLKLKGVFVAGGDTGGSAGVGGGEPREGRVYGAVLSTDFFQGRLTTAIEADVSSIEPSADAESGNLEGEAWSARAAGVLGVFGYEAAYEHRGREFLPIGNLQLEPDRAIASAGVSATLPAWRAAVKLSNTENNVEDDPALTRAATVQGTVDLSYTGFANAPFGASWQQSRQRSSHDLEGALPIDLTTTTFAGWANLAWGRLTLGLQATRSDMEDGNDEGTDTTTSTYSVTPSLNLGPVTVAPSYTSTRAKSTTTGVATDTQVAALDLRSAFFGQRLGWDLAGSWSASKASDASFDTASLDANARLALAFGPYRYWPAKMSLALKGVYSQSEDKVGGQKTDDLAVYLAVTAAIPLF